MICIGCGCDEQHACTLRGGRTCSWVHPGARGLAGICSACVELFPPSLIEQSLETCEIAIAEAEAGGVKGIENAFVGNRERIIEELLARESHHALYGDADPDAGEPAGIASFLEPERPRLILPGDEEFHL